MREFSSALVEQVNEDDAQLSVEEIMHERGCSRADAEDIAAGRTWVDFKLDGRTMRSYTPETTQIAYLMAGMGRGQSAAQRFASMINVMTATLRDDDKDFFEGLLLAEGQRKINPDLLEEVFTHLTEEWFREESAGDRPSE